jgi:hypothetical protein
VIQFLKCFGKGIEVKKIVMARKPSSFNEIILASARDRSGKPPSAALGMNSAR